MDFKRANLEADKWVGNTPEPNVFGQSGEVEGVTKTVVAGWDGSSNVMGIIGKALLIDSCE